METAGTIKVRYHKGPVPVWQETLASFFFFLVIYFLLILQKTNNEPFFQYLAMKGQQTHEGEVWGFIYSESERCLAVCVIS